MMSPHPSVLYDQRNLWICSRFSTRFTKNQSMQCVIWQQRRPRSRCCVPRPTRWGPVQSQLSKSANTVSDMVIANFEFS